MTTSREQAGGEGNESTIVWRGVRKRTSLPDFARLVIAKPARDRNRVLSAVQHRDDLNFVRCDLIANHERKTLGNQSTIVTLFLMNTRKTFKPLNVLQNATDEVVAESILLAILEQQEPTKYLQAQPHIVHGLAFILD